MKEYGIVSLICPQDLRLSILPVNKLCEKNNEKVVSSIFENVLK